MNEQKNSLSVVTILPPPTQTSGSAQTVMGTRVILSDGSELDRVQAVTLTAKAGGVWEATITVLPKIIEPVTAEATIHVSDVTSLSDESRQYAKVSND